MSRYLLVIIAAVMFSGCSVCLTRADCPPRHLCVRTSQSQVIGQCMEYRW